MDTFWFSSLPITTTTTTTTTTCRMGSRQMSPATLALRYYEGPSAIYPCQPFSRKRMPNVLLRALANWDKDLNKYHDSCATARAILESWKREAQPLQIYVQDHYWKAVLTRYAHGFSTFGPPEALDFVSRNLSSLAILLGPELQSSRMIKDGEPLPCGVCFM